MNRKLLATLAGAALVASAVVGGAPAHAQTSDVTFTLTGGLLSISTPAASSLTLASGALGSGISASGALGSTTVTDNRNALTGWQVTAASTAITQRDGNGDPVPGGGSIPPANVTIAGTLASAVTGLTDVNLLVPTSTTGAANGAILTAPTNVVSAISLLDTRNTATYSPTVTVNVPAGTPAGDYKGTITQTLTAL